MQILLNISDDVYQKLVNAGVDMQSKINDYLITLIDKKDAYLHSQQFQDDKKYFNDALNEVESGKIKPLSQKEYDSEMQEFMSSL